MFLSRSTILALGLVFSGFTFATGAEEPNRPARSASDDIEQFFFKLQQAVAANQPQAVVNLVKFPLRVNQPNKKPKYITKTQFTSEYPLIFTPKVAAVVASQDPKTLFQNYKGAMFGNGEVWLSSICTNKDCTSSQVLVISVNLPSD